MKTRWFLMLLSLLGMSACEDDDTEFPAPMYGCPHGDYIVRGTVSDPEGNPIPAIRIVSDAFDSLASTDEAGRYEIAMSLPYDYDSLRAEDVDGELNGGLFVTKSFPEIEFTDRDRTAPGDNDWYMGRFEKRIDLTLERQNGKEAKR